MLGACHTTDADLHGSVGQKAFSPPEEGICYSYCSEFIQQELVADFTKSFLEIKYDEVDYPLDCSVLSRNCKSGGVGLQQVCGVRSQIDSHPVRWVLRKLYSIFVIMCLSS